MTKNKYIKAYALLSKRDYSVAVMKKLIDFAYADSCNGFSEIVIDGIIDDLKEKNWLSDNE